MQEQDVQYEWECCLCAPNETLDDLCLILYRRTCPVHGPAWHRQMVRGPDSTLMLAVPRKPPDSVKDAGRKPRQGIA